VESQFQFDWQAAIDPYPFPGEGYSLTRLDDFVRRPSLSVFLLALFVWPVKHNKHCISAGPQRLILEYSRHVPILVQVLSYFIGLPDLVGARLIRLSPYCGHRPELGAIFLKWFVVVCSLLTAAKPKLACR